MSAGTGRNELVPKSSGPTRNRVAGTNRTQPYTVPQQQQQPSQQHRSEEGSSNSQGQSSTDNTAAARVQAPQLLVTACSCRDPNNPTDLNQLTTNATPMLFVPFSVPNFAPAPMTGSNLHATNCSPSKDMKGGWSTSPGTTAPVVNAPTLLAVQPILTQANNPVQTIPQPPQPTAPKQDTSSKVSY
ncbi:hypothetical protein Trydic_g10712 [Trypoxylus dichotomus]